jgi:hypothetical protein
MAVLEPQRRRMPGQLWKIGYLGAARMASMFLGVFLVFSRAPWYEGFYGARPLEHGLTPLVDQRYAGGMMMTLDIIVVFLARESKLLSHNGARSSLDNEIDAVVRELGVFEPSIKENHAGAEETVGEERGVDEAAVLMSTQQLGQRETSSTTLGVKEMPEEEGEEEATELPADELNRRVEDFIARFNMERQLEERTMVVCF